MDTSVKWKKWTDILTIIFLCLTASSAILGAGIGYRAWQEYRNANKIQTINTLLDLDKDINKLMIEKSYLQGIFVIHPKNGEIKKSLNNCLRLFFVDKDDDIWQNWKDIPELHNKLFGIDKFNNKNRQKLREAYFVAESILYILFNAYIAKKHSLISDDDYEAYTGYFDEVGQNPLFLCAIYCGHRYCYFTKGFAEEVRNRLIKKPKIVRVLKIVYQDLLNDNWAYCIGEKK